MGKNPFINYDKLPKVMRKPYILEQLVKLGFTIFREPSLDIKPKIKEDVTWSMKDGERYSAYKDGKFLQSFYWAGITSRFKAESGHPIYIRAVCNDGVYRDLRFEQPIQIYPYDGEEDIKSKTESSSVDHPAHYNKHPSGIEAIQVCEHMSFNLGNAMKYIWRADHKGNAKQDLEKAIWYIKKEIERVYENKDKKD